MNIDFYLMLLGNNLAKYALLFTMFTIKKWKFKLLI